MSSILNWFQFFFCSKQDVSVKIATPGVVSAEGCLYLFHKDTILELSLAQLTPVLQLNLQMSTLLLSLSQQYHLASLYDEQKGQRLLVSTTGAAEELVPTWDTQCVHPPTHLAGRALQPVFMLHQLHLALPTSLMLRRGHV